MHFPTWVDLKGQDSVPETVHHVVNSLYHSFHYCTSFCWLSELFAECESIALKTFRSFLSHSLLPASILPKSLDLFKMALRGRRFRLAATSVLF